MAWGDEQIIVGDETYIYYAGYARGHKVDRFNERQIGLARMPRDRYVAREASLNPGTLITRPLVLQAGSITVNARVVGELKLRLLNPDGTPLQGYNWIDLAGDAVNLSAGWMNDLSAIRGNAVRIEFQLTNAQLFSFDLL